MDEKDVERIKVLFADEGFAKELSQLNDFEDIKKLFASKGVCISDADLESLLEGLLAKAESAGEELSVNQLKEISGGFVDPVTLLVLYGLSIGFAGYLVAYGIREIKEALEALKGRKH